MGHFAFDRVTKTISAQNTYSSWMWCGTGKAQLTLDGLSDSTVTLQVGTDGDINNQPTAQVDADTYTLENSYPLWIGSPKWYRFGVKTGDYGSDTIVGELRQ